MKKIIYSIACIVFCAFAVETQAQSTLTLEQARTQALANNKKLASANAQVEKMGYDVKAMKSNFFPNFSATAIDFYNTSKFSFAPQINGLFGSIAANGANAVAASLQNLLPTLSAEQQQLVMQQFAKGTEVFSQVLKLPDDAVDLKVGNVFSGGISFVEPLYAGGKINTGYKMTRLGQQMATTNVRLTESEVILNTDQAYVLCIRAKELGDVAKSYKTLLEELKKNVDAAVRHGMKTRNDALKVEVKLNEAELNIVKAENALRLAQMNLAQVIGLPLTQKIEVSTEGLYKEQIVTDKNGDISARPEVSLLADKTEMARLNIKLTRSDFLPKLVMGASYAYTNGMKLMNETLMKSGNATVGVMLQVPIYHFGEGRNKIRSAKASYRMAQMEEDDLKEKMQLEQMQAYNNVTESATEIKITEKSVEAAAANMKTSKQAFEVGTEPLSDYLEAQTLWQKACAQAVEARCQYFISYSKYLKTCGELQ